MTKTEILKFCGNNIYPIHNGTKRGLPEVGALLESNRQMTNLNPTIFYGRQRGINCIPMYVVKEFLKADLVGIEKGLVTYDNIYYKEINVTHSDFDKVKIFIYGKEDDTEISLTIPKWGNGDYSVEKILSGKGFYGRYLMLDLFYDILLTMNGDKPWKQSRNNTNRTVIIFCMKFSLENNGITIEDDVHIELSDQAIERVKSYATYGGIAYIEAKKNFDMCLLNTNYQEASRLHYYYDLLKKEYYEKGF